MTLRTRILLRAAGMLILLVVGTCVAVLAVVLDHHGADACVADTLWAVLGIGGAMLVLGLLLSWWAARVTTREIDRANRALQESESRHRALVENIRFGIVLTDAQHRIIMTNPALAAMFGKSPSDLVGQLCYRLFEKRECVCDGCPGVQAMATGKLAEADREGVRDDGTRFAVRNHAFPILNADGLATSFIEVVEDVTECKQIESELRLQNIILSTQQEASIDGILVVDNVGKVLSFNRRFVELWGIPSAVLETRSDDLALQSVLDKLADPQGFLQRVRRLYEHLHESSRDEIALRDGRTFDRYSAPMFGSDGQYYGRVWYFRDITERCRAQEALEQANLQLEELATTDELTGLWNRRRLAEVLKVEIERARREETVLSVVMLDVDQFKPINDACGHALGDLVLREIAKVLRETARTTDVVARYGGDEFVVLMPDTSAEAGVSAAERLRQAVEHDRISDGCRGIRVTVSVGVAALRTGQTDTPDTLLRAADEALLAAKSAGRNCVRVWGREADAATDEMSVNREAVERLRSRVVALSRRSREMFVRGVRVLVHEDEIRDPYAKFHSENVASYAACIARAMGLDAEQVAVIRRAGLLHDIGKIGVPDEVLWKPAGLTEPERILMQQHVVVGVRVLDQLRFLEREVPLVRHHHERYDGCGYPDGISGEAIPLGARILGVADAFDAITTDRPYRQARTVHEAVQMIVTEAGHQFDPTVVDALLRWVVSVSRSHGNTGNVTVADLCDGRPEEIEAAEEVAAR